jgi:hypothetical protein
MSLSLSDRSSKQPGASTASPEKAAQNRAARAANRSGKLARAKQLARDPHYPSDEVLSSIARHFARHWGV